MFKIGILIQEDGTIYQWQKYCIDSISHKDNIFIEYFIPFITYNKSLKNRNETYSTKIAKILLKKKSKFHKKIIITEQVKKINFYCSNNIYELDKNDLNKFKDIDILVRFSLDIIKGDILNAPKIGVVSFHHGSMKFFRGGPAGFWEIIKNSHLTISLQILNSNLDGGEIICESHLKNYFDFKQNRNLLYNSSSFVFEKGINDLINRNKLQNNFYIYNDILFKHPNILYVILMYCITFYKKLINKFFIKYISNNNWNIFISKKSFFFNSLSLYKLYNVFKFNNKILRADPFIIKESSDELIFIYEKLDKTTNFKGEIYKTTIDLNTLSIINDQLFLRENYHLSFPFFFDEMNIILPEQRKNFNTKYFYYNIEGKIAGYLNLKYINLTDIVLYKKGIYVYAFATHVIRDLSDCILRLFVLNENLELINEHICSPICVGQDRSRMAGKLLTLNNKLYRFHQNNLNGYGSDFGISEILIINPHEYEEKIIQYSSKRKNFMNTHHIDVGSKYFIFDGKK
jgi:hypothetical protein